MYIVAIAWIYVVVMMSITEETVVAGVMTFALYGILPLSLILYIMGTPQRNRRRAALAAALAARNANPDPAAPESIPDIPAPDTTVREERSTAKPPSDPQNAASESLGQNISAPTAATDDGASVKAVQPKLLD